MFGFLRKKEKEVVPELDWKELRLQSINNVNYLKSHINVLNSVIEKLKMGSARAEKARIDRLSKTREWMLIKLREEEVCVDIFDKKVCPDF